ncbi:hypothetical protein PR202_ga02166 [Eleusine coracana subsp. coracana]|uniref:ELMO domain-containing protein n=1 Tax=Eleusine coracana subsp. coracana TaxID=191504 RepID=A0AAV5BJE7_ELECO|nr:hypothetical protein PR202_ga02166 [Eleusine coracana subsp. coracana]
MDANAGSFVAVRRLSGSDRAAAFHHSSSAEVVTGSTAWIGKGLSCVCAQRRDSDARLSFDLTPTQEECLQRLQDRIEVQYDSTNSEHQKSFQELLRKQNGDRAIWEYPFAVAGVNITFMLIQMLDLQAVKPRSLFGAVFLKFLSENDRAFDILYCITFKLMDQQWLDMHATYMDFNTVMKSTRRQLERELLLEDIQRIEDMPSYRLLAR